MLEVDFADGSVLRRRVLIGLITALLLAALAIGVLAARNYSAAAAIERELAAKNAAIEQAAAAAAAAAQQAEETLRTSPDQRIRMLEAFPWREKLAAVEGAADVGVRVTSLRFSALDGTLRLEVAYGDKTKLLDYVERLNAGLQTAAWKIENVRWSAQGTDAHLTAELSATAR
jgi:hypothetical protein